MKEYYEKIKSKYSMLELYAFFMVFVTFMGPNFLKFQIFSINFNFSRVLLIGTFFIVLNDVIKKRKLDIKCNNGISKRIIVFYIIWFIYSLLTIFMSKDIMSFAILTFFILMGLVVILFFGKYIDIYKTMPVFFRIIEITLIVNCFYYLFLYYIKEINIGGFYHNSNDLATVMIFGIEIAFFLTMKSKEKKNRIIHGSILFILVAIFIHIMSRGCIIGLVFALTVSLVAKLYKNREKILKERKYLMLVTSVSIIFIVVGILFCNKYVGSISLTPVTKAKRSNDIRINLIYSGIHFLGEKANIITGIGAGNSTYYLKENNIYYTHRMYSFHNFWLEILVEFGIIIFMFYVVVYFSTMKKLLLSAYGKMKHYNYLLFYFWLAFVIAGISSSSMLTREWLLFMYAFSFLLINKKGICEKTDSEEKNALMIATYFPPMNGIGTVRVTKFAKYLKKYGWNANVITIDESMIDFKDNSLLNDIENVNVYRLKFNKKHKDISIDFYKALKKNMRKILREKQYDIVYVTCGPFFTMPIGKYLYNQYGLDYVIDMRDPWSTQTQSNSKSFKQKVKKLIKNIVEIYSFSSAKKIITINDKMSEEYRLEYKRYKDKIKTISNGFDLSDYINIKPRKMSGFNVVYAGKFETAAGFRNPKSLFTAISKCLNEKKDINFVHVGDKENKIIEMAKSEKIYDNCVFVGKKPFNTTISYCKSADLLIVIGSGNKNEQTGKIFDYICCNVPILVLASKNTEIAKVCKNFDNIYFASTNNVDEIKKVIAKIFQGKTKKNNVMKLKNSDYNREKLTGLLVDVFDE